MFFKHIEAAPADPILGLGEAFKAETRPEKSQSRHRRVQRCIRRDAYCQSRQRG